MIIHNMSQVQWLAAIGVLVDIVGALILSRSFIWSKPHDLAAQQQARWVGNPDFLKALSEQTVDAHWGGGMLAVGFVLQLCSNVGFAIDIRVFLALVIVLVLCLFGYLWFRSVQVKAVYMA